MLQTDPKLCINSTRPSYLCNPEKPEMNELDQLKIGITVGLFLGVLVICILCYSILCLVAKCSSKHHSQNGSRKVFSYMNLFSGGVFFATSFLHLLPEAREEMQKFSELASTLLDFPACEFMASIGFFLVLFAEQLTSKLHKIYEARKKTNSSPPTPSHTLTADAAFNIPTEDETVENEKKKTTPETKSISVENISESEKWDNKSTSVIICNEDNCTDCNISSNENLNFPDEELPSNRDCKENDFVYSMTNRNEISSSNTDRISLELQGIVNFSTPIPYSHESSAHDVQSENSYTKSNPELSASGLPYCNCSLNQLDRYMNPNRNATNTTRAIPESYIQRAIGSTDSLSTTQPTTREGYRAIILLISLLFHSLFDGLALGLQSDPSNVYTILVAIFLHKTLVAFSLTLKLYRAFPGRYTLVSVCLFLFSIISPVGCLIGWMVSGSNSIHIVIRTGCSGILQSLATGTFLYVTFIEILGPELGHGNSKFKSIFFVLLGYLLIAILKIVV